MVLRRRGVVLLCAYIDIYIYIYVWMRRPMLEFLWRRCVCRCVPRYMDVCISCQVSSSDESLWRKPLSVWAADVLLLRWFFSFYSKAICWRMLTYADLTYADVCWRMLTCYFKCLERAHAKTQPLVALLHVALTAASLTTASVSLVALT
jgi:hypothetical protein